MTNVVNRLSFDIEDWFQVENLRSAVDRSAWDSYPLRVEQSTRTILGLLRERNVRATFFFLGWVAERCPNLVREVQRDGHEIASHGYGHDLVYDMSESLFREDAKRAKGILEDITGQAVVGYRAPSFTIVERTKWALDVLRDEGFVYDSSVFPLTWHDRYGFKECDTVPFAWPNGLIEVPIAVARLGRMSLPVGGGGYFRLFPYAYFHSLLKRNNRRGEAFTFYMHPWEFDPEQPRMNVKLSHRFRHYVNLDQSATRLRRILADFAFEPIRDHVERLSALELKAA